MIHLSPTKTSGRKTWVHLTADSERELQDMARRLHEPIKREGGKGKTDHLDLSEHKRTLALRYGAVEE